MLFLTRILMTAADPTGQGAQKIIDLINSIFPWALGIVIAAGSIFSIILGVKFAKAEEPQDREKAKQHLKNAIIGFVLIFVLIMLLRVLPEPLLNWAKAD